MALQYIPNEVIADIYHYLNPNRLHKLASCSLCARYVINGYIARARYIERWLDTSYNSKTFIYNLNKKCQPCSECDIEHILNNYWYYILEFNYDNYDKLLKIIDNIKNKNLSIYI